MGLNKLTRLGMLKFLGDLIQMGFSELRSVSCVFIKWFGTGIFVLVLVYVDDLLMLSPSGVQLEEVSQAIAAIYEIRRMKDVNCYLGVELRWSKRQGGAMVLHMLQCCKTGVRQLTVPRDGPRRSSCPQSLRPRDGNELNSMENLEG
jgi:Reverse transcriptase (RNA-dependent DNA polymerase)